jgi:putative ABC transport system permease protein
MDQQIKPGFDSANVTTAFVIKPRNDPGFLNRLQETLRSSPGVEAAAIANPVPFTTGGFSTKGRQRSPNEPEWHGEAYQISPEYLATLRIPLVRGRNLSASDTAISPLVCLIDAKLADRFFPNQDPIGQEIGMDRPV